MIVLRCQLGSRLDGRLGSRLGGPYRLRRIVASVLTHRREDGHCSGDDQNTSAKGD
jgi:hypothetical protein